MFLNTFLKRKEEKRYFRFLFRKVMEAEDPYESTVNGVNHEIVTDQKNQNLQCKRRKKKKKQHLRAGNSSEKTN